MTPTAISHTFAAPFSVYCKYFVDQKEQDPHSEFQDLIVEIGKRHEKQVIKDLYPGAQKLIYETPEEGFKMVLRSMFDGIGSITQAPLYYSADGLFGYADVIEKRQGKSTFGNHYYVVKEIKSARNIRKMHKIQTAVYNYMLGKIQKRTPETFEIINKDEKLTEIRYSEVEQPMLKALKDLKGIVTGRLIPTPNWNNEDYPWKTYSNKRAIELHDVSLVNGVGPAMKQKMISLDIKTVNDLLKCSDKKLLEIPGVAETTLQKLKNSAKAISSGKHFIISRDRLKFPKPSKEIFLDLEGTIEIEEVPKIDFLIGCLVRNRSKELYKSFVSKSLNGEKKMWEEFQEWLLKQGNFIIYHWASYEHTAFKRFKELYGCNKKAWRLLEERTRDLKTIADKSVSFPTYGLSIKQVAPYCGFRWRQKDVGATESIALYFQYLEKGDKNALKKILDYNEDDVIATRTVKDWLAKI